MKPFIVVFGMLFVPWLVAQTDVGMDLPSNLVPQHYHVECAATPSQTYPCLQNVKLDGVKYAVLGYDKRTHRIKYLLTYDESFRTKDGLHVGSVMEWSEDKVWGARGGFVVGPKTEDGWRPILDSFYHGQTINTDDGETVDLEKRDARRWHPFKVIGFDKGGI